MNKTLAVHVLQAFLDAGGVDVCVCPGSRNAPLVTLIAANRHIKAYYFYEERSAAYFALGLSRRHGRPTAIITTSGTAAVELMPALTEAFYSGIPLVAITADRPRNYRGTNAPQSCEQVGLYGQYAVWSSDLAGAEKINLTTWDQSGPAHINVCFQEPLKCVYQGNELTATLSQSRYSALGSFDLSPLTAFLANVKHPLVIVGALEEKARAGVRRFLQRLNCPVYFDGISGLREDLALAHLRIHQSAGLWQAAETAGYPIDGVLRVGGVPTVRLWRDLEDLEDKVKVCSVSDRPFSGLSWGKILCVPLQEALGEYQAPKVVHSEVHAKWRAIDAQYQAGLEKLFTTEPAAEPSLMHVLVKKLPDDAVIYLGNSLPIRNWDLAAPYREMGFDIWATRGLSGIEGQVSTFLGLCLPEKSNWAFLGDLTTLYDMAGFWAAAQLQNISFNIVVINNGGGQIFSRMYAEAEFLNAHTLRFKSLAEMWGLQYERWERIPDVLPLEGKRIIELVPDNEAYQRFWQKLTKQIPW